jgi:2-polyprenyl-3-methyl-5-hydroxy-6-metoxy-1,4-benzoquinol methylase
VDSPEQQGLRRRIIAAYETRLVRAYCAVRFVIINLNTLHLLSMCMRGRVRVLEIGCGFGLFGCYFASKNPLLRYHGIDLNAGRIAMANRAARRLSLDNISFEAGDAGGDLRLEDQYDVVLLMDLVHHIPDDAKHRLFASITSKLKPGGRIVIKDIARKPALKLFFTWVLDVLMTRGFDMRYWDERRFRGGMDPAFRMETYRIPHWLPYPHVLYVFSRDEHASR